MRKIVAALFFLLVSGIQPLAAADYTFGSIELLVEQEVGRIVLPEIYKKLGLSIDIIPLPANRAQKKAVSGVYDGEIMRIWEYGEQNPQTIRVPTPYYALYTTAFVKKGSKIDVRTVKELAGFRLAKVMGVKHTDLIAKNHLKATDLKSTVDMMQFLDVGRADIALTNTLDGKLAIQKLGLHDIEMLEQPLAEHALYHYVHESHRELVPYVDAIIKHMRRTGELQELVRKAEKEILRSAGAYK